MATVRVTRIQPAGNAPARPLVSDIGPLCYHSPASDCGGELMEKSTATITVTVPDVDADVVRRLKNLAAQNNRSLESELRCILEKAIANDAEAMAAKHKAFRELSRELLKLTAGKPQIPAEVLVRQDRDSDHGRLELPPEPGQ